MCIRDSDSGTTVTIRDLTLPFLADTAGIRSYRAGQISILTATRDSAAPFEMAAWIERLLTLPELLAGSEVIIDRLDMPPYRPVSAIHWVVADDTQALAATMEGIPMSVAIASGGSFDHELFLSTARARIDASLEMTDTGISMRGGQALSLADWMPLAALAGLVPDGMRIDSGGADGRFEIGIPYDTGTTPVIDASVVPTVPWRITYDTGTDDVTVLVAASDEPFMIHAAFPDVAWELSSKRAGLTVNYGDWRNIPLTLTDLHCRSGVHCSMATAISMRDKALPIGNTAAFEWSSMLDLAIGDEATRIGMAPGAALSLQGLSDDPVGIGALAAQFVSGATLIATEDGWSLVADAIDGRVEQLSLTDAPSVSADVFLEQLALGGAGERLTARLGVYTPSSKVAIAGMTARAPGLRGTVSVDGPVIEATLETVGLHDDGSIEAAHNTASGIGRISLDRAGISFGARTLGERFSPWPYPWSVSSGTMSLSLEANWNVVDATLRASSSMQLADLAGFYDDIAFIGLSTTLDAVYDAKTGLTIAPAALSLALVDIGLPLENITARYRLDANNRAVDVDALRMEAFDGVIWAEPFSFRTSAQRNTLTLNAEKLDLAELLAMQDFEAIDVTGRISALLPVTIADDRILIEGGTLTGEAPGGHIQYSDGAGEEPTAGAIALARQALSNFEFDTLSSTVAYGTDGDLKLQMKLTGRNPDLESRRPVVLNLGVESNIPQMLSSLQASRAVEQIIKKRAER